MALRRECVELSVQGGGSQPTENSMDVMGSKSCRIKADRVFGWHTEITTFGITQWTAPVLNGAFGEHHADPSQFRP
jgi:hypothetical protein